MSTTVINEDYGRMIDLIIGADWVRKAFCYKGSRKWIESVDDEFMRAGLEELTDMQIRIVEGILLRNCSIYEVGLQLNMTSEMVMKEIKEIRNTLLKYI